MTNNERNPYTVAYSLAYDAYGWSEDTMWDILDICITYGKISQAEAEMIAEDVICEYNTK